MRYHPLDDDTLRSYNVWWHYRRQGHGWYWSTTAIRRLYHWKHIYDEMLQKQQPVGPDGKRHSERFPTSRRNPRRVKGVCWDCRRSFKVKYGFEDIGNSTSTCPSCNERLTMIHWQWRPPRKHQVRAWKQFRKLVES